jgi:hypothetical protein
MLLAIEAFFFHGSKKFAVSDDGRGGVAVIRINSQDVQMTCS